MTDGLELLLDTVKDAGLRRVVGQRVVPAAPRALRHSWGQTREETIKLVQSLFIATGEAAPQVVAFAAVESGSGCTWVCAQTAGMMAEHLERPVCAVDANFRSPGLRRYFEVEDLEKTPAEWLSTSIVEQPANRADLCLLSYSPEHRDWQTPSSLDQFQARISKLRKYFAYILIDAPPINASGDAALLGRVADGVVMVIQANSTRREAAQRAKEALERDRKSVV